MNKSICEVVAVIILIIMIISLISSCCQANNDKLVIGSFEPTVYKNLYYDSSTNITYFCYDDWFCPYYAENGLPYHYNTTTEELECINN